MKLSDMAFQRVVHLVTALTVVFLTACGGGGGPVIPLIAEEPVEQAATAQRPQHPMCRA